MADAPEGTVGNVMFDITPSLRANVWMSGNAEADSARLAATMAAVRGWLSHDAKTRISLGVLTDEERAAKEKEAAERRQQEPPRQQNGGGQRRQRPPADPNAPNCPEHRAPMRRNRRDDGWFCSRKNGQDYCDEKVWDN